MSLLIEMVTSESPSDSPYVSAPTSPTRSSFNSALYFYSVPTSPKNSPFDWELEGVSKKNIEIDSNLDDFEFKTSQNFERRLDHQQQQQHEESLPAMSFADELFCNGQVLPLKLPPRLQYTNSMKGNTHSSSASPSSILKGPFSRWKSGNGDFDPFMAALEHVRKDLGSPHRRARSLSPLRNTPQWSNYSIGRVPHQNKKVGPRKPIQHVGSIPSRPTEPKMSVPARRLRQKRWSHEGAIKPTLTGPTVKTSESHGKSAKKIGSEGKTDREEKLRDQTAGLTKDHHFRRLSFKSIHATHYCAKQRVSKEMKKNLMPYGPRMFLCLGFGLKGTRNMT